MPASPFAIIRKRLEQAVDFGDYNSGLYVAAIRSLSRTVTGEASPKADHRQPRRTRKTNTCRAFF